MYRQYVTTAATIVALVLAATTALATTPLPRDDKNIYGQYENGVKYIVREHANPPGRVAFYLHIKAGALEETDNQNGLAHFLEHMCFNGSKNFPPGELIPIMSKLGMTFGAHSNAHTTYHETVYKLFMPDTKDETVELALKVFGDWADGLLLSTEEVDKERGVILEEARRGKSAQERLRKKFMKNVFEDTRIAVHDVIGKEDQIEQWPRDEFVDYWNTWYRPDNMTFIIVGDIKAQEMINRAEPFVGKFKARSNARKKLGGQVDPVNKARAFAFTDPEQVMCQVQILAVNAGRPPMKTDADYRNEQIERIGTWILSRRFQELVQKGEAAFFGAGCFVQSFFNEALIPGAGAGGQPENWNKMLEQVIVELNRAIEHGFTEQELDLAKETFITGAERFVQQEPTLDARRVVGSLARAVGVDDPILSAQQRLDLTRQVMEEVSLDQVNAAFKRHFGTRNFTYVLTLPEKEEIVVPTGEEILAAANEAWAKTTEAKVEEALIVQLLDTLPAPGKVVKQHTDQDLKITTAELSNGVVMHHYFSDYKKDQVWVSILFTGGTIEETGEKRGFSDVASLVNATSKYTSTQIDNFMSTKKVSVGGGVGMDRATLSISGDPAELETGMQLAHLFITDGKIEESGLDVWKKAAIQGLEQRRTTPFGQLSMAMEKSFYGGDTRMTALTEEQINNLTVEQGEAWMKHILDDGAIEVAVVGDIQLEPALQLVTKYIGSLPPRSPGAWRAHDSLRALVGRGSGPFGEDVKFESITPKAFAMAGYLGAARDNVEDIRKLGLVTRIVSERMIKRIREEEQLVYGIRCSHRPDGAIAGTGMISAGSTTDPAEAAILADTVVEMLDEFANNGPTDEELATAKKQVATDLEKSMKEPTWWLGRIRDMHYEQRNLDELKELPGIYETFTVNDLQEVAQKYMTPERRVRYTIIPEGKETAVPEKEAEVSTVN